MGLDTDNTALRKTELRARLLAARSARTPDLIDSARTALTAVVLRQLATLARPPGCVAAYQPMRTEPGSPRLLADLHSAEVPSRLDLAGGGLKDIA